MGLLDGVRGWFGKKPKTLKDLTLDDLTTEQLTVRNELRQLEQQMERLDRDEAQLKSEYAVATSQTRRESIARRIQEVRGTRTGLRTQVDYCHKMARTINGFIVIKKNMAFFERMGVASALAQMDLAQVESFINEATIDGELQQEKLSVLADRVADSVGRIGEAVRDTSLDDLMAELDGETEAQKQKTQAEEEAKTREAAARQSAQDAELAAVMKDLDSAAARGAEAARKIQTQEPAKPEGERRAAEKE